MTNVGGMDLLNRAVRQHSKAGEEAKAGASLPSRVRPTDMVWKMQGGAGRAGRVMLFAAVWAGGAIGGAQTTPAKDAACGVSDASKSSGGKATQPCPAPAAHTPSVSEQFPYPGERQAVPPAKPAPEPTPKEQFPYPGEPAAQPAKPAGSASDRFPYPGETAGETPGGESSSSSSGAAADPDADSKPKLKDEGTEGDVQPHRRRLRPQAQKTLSDAERVEEDLSVAHFYLQSGNVMGSYLRAKDAVKLQPDASDTHLALAQAADRLGKREEATAEYKAVLSADPEEAEARAARKALERLKP